MYRFTHTQSHTHGYFGMQTEQPGIKLWLDDPLHPLSHSHNTERKGCKSETFCIFAWRSLNENYEFIVLWNFMLIQRLFCQLFKGLFDLQLLLKSLSSQKPWVVSVHSAAHSMFKKTVVSVRQVQKLNRSNRNKTVCAAGRQISSFFPHQ